MCSATCAGNPHSSSGSDPHAACASFTAREPLAESKSASPSTYARYVAGCDAVLSTF